MGTRPSILFRAEVPCAWGDAYDTPVVGEGLLLLAAGWLSDPGRDCATALVALDAVSGAQRWQLEVRVLRPGASACQVGLPTTTVDGLVLVPMYQWDAALQVYVLDRQGGTVRVDDLASQRERQLDVRADDRGIRLSLQPLHTASGAYLMSWVYRDRDYHAQCRDLATGALRWESEEVVLAAENGVAICGSDVVCAMVVRDDDGIAWWQTARRRNGSARPRAQSIAEQTVVAAAEDESAVLLATADGLASVPLATPDAPTWRQSLPVDPRTYAPGHLAHVRATLANRRLYVRAGTDLSAFAMP